MTSKPNALLVCLLLGSCNRATVPAVEKKPAVMQELRLKPTEAKKWDDKVTIKFADYSIEQIAASPDNPEAYPAGSGVNITLELTEGAESQRLTFSQLSTGYTSTTDQSWHGYKIGLKDFKLSNITITEARFSIEAVPANQAKRATP